MNVLWNRSCIDGSCVLRFGFIKGVRWTKHQYSVACVFVIIGNTPFKISKRGDRLGVVAYIYGRPLKNVRRLKTTVWLWANNQKRLAIHKGVSSFSVIMIGPSWWRTCLTCSSIRKIVWLLRLVGGMSGLSCPCGKTVGHSIGSSSRKYILIKMTKSEKQPSLGRCGALTQLTGKTLGTLDPPLAPLVLFSCQRADCGQSQFFCSIFRLCWFRRTGSGWGSYVGFFGQVFDKQIDLRHLLRRNFKLWDLKQKLSRSASYGISKVTVTTIMNFKPFDRKFCRRMLWQRLLFTFTGFFWRRLLMGICSRLYYRALTPLMTFLSSIGRCLSIHL